MFARFDENQAMTLQDIKETKRYGRTTWKQYTHHKQSLRGKFVVGYNYNELFEKRNFTLNEQDNTLGTIVPAKQGDFYGLKSKNEVWSGVLPEQKW